MNKKPSPPKLHLRFFRWFCHPEYVEDIEGDLMERFKQKVQEQSVKKAKWIFLKEVILLFRPEIIRSLTGRYHLTRYAMFKNYLKVGFRNILKYKTFSFINIFGLAISMSVGMLIITLLADQKSYDQFHQNKDRLYRIISDEANSKAANALTAFPLAGILKTNYPIIEKSTHLIRGVSVNTIYDQQNAALNGYFTDTSFFDVFSYEWALGDKSTALTSPNSIVITSEIAHQLFRGENPIGKTVDFFNQGEMDSTANWGLFTVIGVLANSQEKSHLKFDVLVSSASLPILFQTNKINDFTNSWQAEQSYTYVLLDSDKKQEDLTVALNDLVSHQYTNPDVPKGFMLMGQKLSNITPGIIVRNPPSDNLPMMAYYFLAFLAAVIMLSACLNYMNLSIARSLNRAKEIGVRKVTGAYKRDLILQFLTESVINSLLALIGALVLLILI
ncbi:MAG: ABC transporter permease, partial [Bacteroidota bacterium]